MNSLTPSLTGLVLGCTRDHAFYRHVKILACSGRLAPLRLPCSHACIEVSALHNSQLTFHSYAHYHTGTVAEPPISVNGRAMGGNRAKNMLGSISQREEELSIRGAEIYDGEQRLVAVQADLEERLNAMAAREQHIQQREEAVQQRENTVQQREQSVHQHEQAVQQREQAIHQREQTIHQREQNQQRKRSLQHEQAVAERETATAAREHSNYEREQAFATFEEGMLRQLEGNYTSIASTVSQMRRAVSNAQGILANRRQQVLYHENFSNNVQGTHGQGKCGCPSC